MPHGHALFEHTGAHAHKGQPVAVRGVHIRLDFEDEARVKDLSDRKLAEVIEEKKASKGIVLFEQEFEKKDVVEALKSIGVSVTANMREGTLLSKAGELDEEKTSALKEALGIE